MIIKWTEKYETGIKSIDYQHKLMAEYINQFLRNSNTMTSDSAIGDIIQKLLKYTEEHFAYEEELFEKYDFPGKREHLEAHGNLKAKVHEYQERYEKNNIIPTPEMFGFLIDWFLGHIKQVDFKYVDFLKEKGVK